MSSYLTVSPLLRYLAASGSTYRSGLLSVALSTGSPAWELPSTLPCGARTFLDTGLPAPRPPGQLQTIIIAPSVSRLGSRHESVQTVTRRSQILVAAVAAGLLLLAGLFVLVTSRSDGPPSALGDFPVTMVDDAGATVTVTGAPQRIVSLAPHITETLFALGAGERIVGVASGETHPPAASTLPRVVTDDGLTPDPNAIVQARPDLVLTATTGDWIEPLRTAGLSVITLTASDLGDALKDMRSIGRLTGEAQAASELVSEIRQGIRTVRSTSKSNEGAPKVFVEVFSEPLIGAASESFVGSLVMASGGQAVPESEDPYPAISLDQLNALDPDVYLAAASSAVTIERITTRPGFSDLRAIREQRVHLISDELLLRPGPRMVEGLEAIASIIRETEPA